MTGRALVLRWLAAHAIRASRSSAQVAAGTGLAPQSCSVHLTFWVRRAPDFVSRHQIISKSRGHSGLAYAYRYIGRGLPPELPAGSDKAPKPSRGGANEAALRLEGAMPARRGR